jgi:hypothetical protein
MSDNSYTVTAQNLSRIGATALQSILAPAAKFMTCLPLTEGELAGQPSVVSLATAAATTQTGAVDYAAGDSTLGAVTVTPTHFAQVFGVSNTERQIGLTENFLAPINARAFGNAIWDAVATLFTTTNYSAAVVTADSSTFSVTNFETMLAAVPSSERAVILDSPYFVKVKPQTWHPPGFNSTFESNRWTAAGTKVHGIVGTPAGIICRYGFPQLARPGWQVVAREVGVIPGLEIPFETSLYLILASRQLRCCYSLIFGASVGDPNALKLLTSVS